MNPDVVVIGGGLMGAAIAYGVAGRDLSVLVLDGGDRDFRAATGNFGLVWLQGKGMDMPAYQLLTRQAVKLWPEFATELQDVTGINLHFEQKGGLALCIGEDEFHARRARLLRLHDQLGGGADPDFEMIDRDALVTLLPDAPLSREVVGASYGRSDGCVDPLRLLTALHYGILRRGGELRGGRTVTSLRNGEDGAITVEFGGEAISTARVIIAAGLGTKMLAAQVGLHLPIYPDRGEILVTERLEKFLPLPISGMRQTAEGTILLGTTHDEAGFDSSTTSSAACLLSASAIRRIPALKDVRLVRHWAALRIMTPDTYPIYAQSESHPGVFVALCHSGVTLASVHSGIFADAIIADHLPASLDVFHHRRFDVPQAA